MSLAQLLGAPPTPSGLDEFSWSHWQHHLAIIKAVQQTKSITLLAQQIYPMNLQDIESWLELHQQMHSDMCGVFNIIGNDLSSLDWNNQDQREGWTYLQFSEHRDVAIACGLPI